MKKNKSLGKKTRALRVRSSLFGTKIRPRLTVHRSSKHIYGQIVNDEKGVVLASFSSTNLKKDEVRGKTKSEVAALVGNSLAKIAAKAKIKKVVFDRGGYRYHGRVESLAEGARKGGLDF